MEIDIVKNQVYRHYKGKDYLVKEVAIHSETLEQMVFYECLYENNLGQHWVRPVANFLSKVNINGKAVDRFTLKP